MTVDFSHLSLLRVFVLHLLLLDGLLQVAGGQPFDVVNHNVVCFCGSIYLNDLGNLVLTGDVALLLLYAVTEVVGPFLQLELLSSLAHTSNRGLWPSDA